MTMSRVRVAAPVTSEDARQAFDRVAQSADGKLLLDWLYQRYLLSPSRSDINEPELRAAAEMRNLVLMLLQWENYVVDPSGPPDRARATGRGGKRAG